MYHSNLAVCGPAIWLLCLCTLADASIDGGDDIGDGPSAWQYIVIALALAFAFMAVLVCVQVARLRRRSDILQQHMRPVTHITRSGARVYAPAPILNQNDLELLPIVDYQNVPETEQQSCSICLEYFSSMVKVRMLPCNHAFHPGCIDPWLTKHSAECPMCKRTCVTLASKNSVAEHWHNVHTTLTPFAISSGSENSFNPEFSDHFSIATAIDISSRNPNPQPSAAVAGSDSVISVAEPIVNPIFIMREPFDATAAMVISIPEPAPAITSPETPYHSPSSEEPTSAVVTTTPSQVSTEIQTQDESK
ncbi:hypothetical protein INT43_006180 [Umbelopsis isabellina]|uniref:RING-type domain-containing protein n=1 Tax=Mortierella isabellina TaxID=91625 RepID=A0A8H7UHF3_MORIS|nr:hypothetical protein INT43_006180 [Umbelopsis isabellina]